MDFKSLKEQRDELKQELVRLKGDPFVKVPSILKLVKSEVTRLNEILLGMGPDDMHVDVDGLMMIDHLSNEFGLSDVSSVDLLSNQLMKELRTMNLCFHPQLLCIANFILMVVNRLEQKVSREVMAHIHNVGATASSSQEPKQASVDDSKSHVVGVSSTYGPLTSAQKTEGQGSCSSPQSDDSLARKDQEWCIDVAIRANMQSNPHDFCVEHVIEVLRQYSRLFCVNVDDEDVRRLIVQKCDEAVVSRDKKLVEQGDQGKSCSKKE